MRHLINEGRRILGEAYVGKGVMVALFPPPYVCQKLSALGSEDSKDIHATLAFLGTTDELSADKLAQAEGAIARVAQKSKALTAKIAGVGRFSASETSDGKDVVYANVDAPGLTDLRARVVEALKKVGIEISRVHGFTPHITLGYIPMHAPMPISRRMSPIDCTFTRLVLAVGGEHKTFTLRGK